MPPIAGGTRSVARAFDRQQRKRLGQDCPSSATAFRWRPELRGRDEHAVADAYRALADGHVIVLEHGTTTVRWAPPFSVVPTPFQSNADGARWYAPCAWDAFGIPAALCRDADVEARCAWSGEPVVCGVRNGRAYGDGIIHLVVPAARFWDDIGYT